MALFTCGLIAKTANLNLTRNLAPKLYLHIASTARHGQPTTLLKTCKNSPSKAARRTFYGWFKRPTPAKLREADRLPESYRLIYRNGMGWYLLLGQIVSLTSAALVTITVLIETDFKHTNVGGTVGWGYKPRVTKNEHIIYLTVVLGLVVVLQALVRKMPLRIYREVQSERYKFIFYGMVPFTTRRASCKVGEIVKLEKEGILPWTESTYEVKEQHRIIMLEHYFRRPADLNIMLGYQKAPPEND